MTTSSYGYTDGGTRDPEITVPELCRTPRPPRSDLRSHRRIMRQEQKLGAAISSTSGKAHRAAIVRYLQSYAAKVIAARAESGPLTELNPWAGSDESVKVWHQPKESGGTRRLYKFGPERRALHRLVLNALNHAWPASASRDEVVQSVCTRLAGSPTYAIEFDIVDCFGSVARCPNTISKLTGLPAQVVSTLFCDAINGEDEGTHIPSSQPHTDGLPDSKVAEPRLGLPQGSAVSPAIVERLLAPVLELLPKGKVVRYVDNFLIMADSQEEVVSILSALGDALAHHPAGSFSGRVIAEYAPGDTVVFLGYALTPTVGGCSVEADPAKIARFDELICNALQAAEAKPHQRERRLARIRIRISGLPNGFRLWPEGSVYAKEWLGFVEAQCGDWATGVHPGLIRVPDPDSGGWS